MFSPLDQVLNARVRVIGGRNNPDPEDHVQFFTTFKDGTATKSGRFGHAHLEAESGPRSVSPVKIEISQVMNSSSHGDSEVRVAILPVLC